VKERLDCALICVPGCEPLLESLLKHERLHQCRLHFSLVQPESEMSTGPGVFPSASFLQNMTYSLRRFDVLCLPVSPISLAWSRILLQQTRIDQQRPIFALGLALRPIGMLDLLELGAVDFALWPCEPEEIRVRMLRALRELRDQYGSACTQLGDSINTRRYAVHEGAAAHGHAYLSAAQARSLAAGSSGLSGARSMIFSASHPRATAMAATRLPSGRATSVPPAGRRPMPRLAFGSALAEIPNVCCQEIAHYPEGFQQLKSVIVAQFERSYLTHALARSKGNIALAARNSNKHRRAFWALMRKHQISADPFRETDS